jgi:hypothetical protein
MCPWFDILWKTAGNSMDMRGNAGDMFRVKSHLTALPTNVSLQRRSEVLCVSGSVGKEKLVALLFRGMKNPYNRE